MNKKKSFEYFKPLTPPGGTEEFLPAPQASCASELAALQVHVFASAKLLCDRLGSELVFVAQMHPKSLEIT